MVKGLLEQDSSGRDRVWGLPLLLSCGVPKSRRPSSRQVSPLSRSPPRGISGNFHENSIAIDDFPKKLLVPSQAEDADKVHLEVRPEGLPTGARHRSLIIRKRAT